MKYKIGDRVRVKSFKELQKIYATDYGDNGPMLVSPMLTYQGQVRKIIAVYPLNYGSYFYKLEGDKDSWNWRSDWFESPRRIILNTKRKW